MFVILTKISANDRWTAYAYVFETEDQATTHMHALTDTGVYFQLKVKRVV
jgi:hypothetical protein